MLYCTRCGTAIPDGANFCMRCGAPVVRAEAPQPASRAAAAPLPIPIPVGALAMPAPRKSNGFLPFAVVIAAIVAVLLLGLAASGALRKAASNDGDSLRVQGKAPTPVLAKQAQAPAQMPQDVRDWLEHLRRIEERKNKLNSQELAQLQVFSAKFQALGPAAGLLSGTGDEEDNNNPEVPVKSQITDLASPWKQLVKDFQAVPPPPECQRLADEYFAGLNEIPGMMNDVQGVIDSVSQMASGNAPTDSNSPSADQQAKGALDKAYSMQGTSGTSIDAHFSSSDNMLGQICNQYNTPKWFSITPDVGGGMLGKSQF